MRLRNRTHLSTSRLEGMIEPAIEGWPHEQLEAAIRYSRGADFSGTCCYARKQVYVNLGRRNSYPYAIRTHIARASSDRRHWWREVYSVEAADAYQLVLFVFLHEFYHWLVKAAGRNVRQKESRCDRFAARALVDAYGAVVRDADGRRVPRSSWDFQDLAGFVARANGCPVRRVGRPVDAPKVAAAEPRALIGGQMLLFGCADAVLSSRGDLGAPDVPRPRRLSV